LCCFDDEGGYKLEPFIAWSNVVRPMHTPLVFNRQEQIDYLPSLLEKRPVLMSRLEETIDCPRTTILISLPSVFSFRSFAIFWRTAAIIVGVQIEESNFEIPVLFAGLTMMAGQHYTVQMKMNGQ
jgi:hypothetical protein